MDIWATIYLGEQWTDSYGRVHSYPRASEDVKLTTLDDAIQALGRPGASRRWKEIKEAFASLVTETVDRMREDLERKGKEKVSKK